MTNGSCGPVGSAEDGAGVDAPLDVDIDLDGDLDALYASFLSKSIED